MKSLILGVILSLQLIGCKNTEVSNSAQTPDPEPTIGCAKASSDLQNPETFEGVVNLVNSLPKPLTLQCFLENYTHPFEIFATDNFVSAQPSAGTQSPRIFIIKGNFLISVVAEGDAKDFIEFSLVTNSEDSIKGELHFPINQNIQSDAVYTSILDPTNNNGTNCRFCHTGEYLVQGNIYSSRILAPSEIDRVSTRQLINYAQNCSLTTDEFRCKMLQYIFLEGSTKDKTWPF